MTHIFLIHSTICSVVVYSILKEKLTRNEPVIVVLNRGAKFPFFQDEIRFFDAYEQFKDMQSFLGSMLSFSTYKQIAGYKAYIKELTKRIYCFIGEDDFLLYTPNYSVDVSKVMAKSKMCKGYYFIEDGTLSYLSLPKIKSYSYSFKTLLGNVVRSLFGIESCFQYRVSAKFRGTIASSSKAFLWNKTLPKIIVDINEYPFARQKKYDLIFVTGYFAEDMDLMNQSIHNILSVYLINQWNIGIKIHPQAYVQQKEYVCSFIEMLKNDYSNKIDVLPVDFSIESSIVLDNAKIVSLLSISSLLLYSVVWSTNSPILVLNREGNLSQIEIKTPEAFFDICEEAL